MHRCDSHSFSSILSQLTYLFSTPGNPTSPPPKYKHPAQNVRRASFLGNAPQVLPLGFPRAPGPLLVRRHRLRRPRHDPRRPPHPFLPRRLRPGPRSHDLSWCVSYMLQRPGTILDGELTIGQSLQARGNS